MSVDFDVMVVGAGPGGLAAATVAADAGKHVCLVDDNLAVGGQIWRGGSDQAQRWVKRLHDGGADLRLGWRVFDAAVKADGVRALHLENAGEHTVISAKTLVIATGARELFLPFPGWTLPGVYGVGALQAFVQSGLDVRGKRVVIAGTGPLLLATASHLRHAGAHVVRILEQAPLRSLARFAAYLAARYPGKLAEGFAHSCTAGPFNYRTGSWVTRAIGEKHATAVEICSGSRRSIVETDFLAAGFHLVPNTELARLIGCATQNGFVAVDQLQQTSIEGVYCVGEATGIGGAEKALCEGRIAGLAASGRREIPPSLARDINRQISFAKHMAGAFLLRDDLRNLADDATFICRCEDVTLKAVNECSSWREAKLQTRCGMGPCQGRICGAAAEFLFGWETPPPRPPLFPVAAEVLADPPNP